MSTDSPMTGTSTNPSFAVSRDGTRIACFTCGEGPPLVLVHGVLGDHQRWDALRPHLEPDLTIHAMDRRGRGASGDGPSYDIEREFEDVAAVVDAVAEQHGTPVAVYGHSGGASHALGAATLTSAIDRLVLYEPPTDLHRLLPEGLPDRLDALLAEGRDEAVVETFCREVLHLTEEQLDAYRRQPSWPARVAAAHTLPRELAVRDDQLFDPQRAASITIPALLLEGGDTPAGFTAGVRTVAATLPNARIAVLEGQGHTADVLAPELVADHLIAFLGGDR